MSISIWRKLWASVSLSKKVNKLSDQAALFWTWAIPHFSTHGFLEYDPEDLKSIVVPLRTSYTPKIINSCIQEILNQNLWNAYVFKKGRVNPTMEGRVNVILHDPRWFEMQNIRKDRISQLPYNIKEMERIYKLLPECPGVSWSVQVPECPAIEIEESEMRVRERKAEKTKAPSLIPTEDQKKELATLCAQVSQKFKDQFNPWMWIQKNITLNPQTHIHVMQSMTHNSDIQDPWPYANKIAMIEDGNYNERDFQNRSEKNKSIYNEILTDIKALHGKKEKQDPEK